MSRIDYDFREVYEREVRPLFNQLLEISSRHKIPMMLATTDYSIGDQYHNVVSYNLHGDQAPRDLLAATLVLANPELLMSPVIHCYESFQAAIARYQLPDNVVPIKPIEG
jgi:hypothetical protein